MRPGVVLDVGTVRCDVVAFALPCTQNARWFRGGDFNLMHHGNGPVARVYALVTEPGTTATGDDVTVMPDGQRRERRAAGTAVRPHVVPDGRRSGAERTIQPIAADRRDTGAAVSPSGGRDQSQ